jgi:hypothetical protein
VSSLWYLDSSQELKDNNGYTTRLKYISNSETVELYGRLPADIFNSDKMLINGVDMDIKLTPSPEAFYLLAPNDYTKVRIKILDATLFITQVEIKSSLLLAHTNIIAKKRKAYYPVKHTQIKTFTANSGTQQISINNALFGLVPDRILIPLVKNAAFFCFTSTDLFHFHHYDMTNLVLSVNGVQHPSGPLTMDCSTPFAATRAYETLFSSTGYHHDARAHMITLEMFAKGYYILGFDLTPDREADV